MKVIPHFSTSPILATPPIFGKNSEGHLPRKIKKIQYPFPLKLERKVPITSMLSLVYFLNILKILSAYACMHACMYVRTLYLYYMYIIYTLYINIYIIILYVYVYINYISIIYIYIYIYIYI